MTTIPVNTTVQIARRVAGTPDRYGNDTPTYAEPGLPLAAWLEQTQAREITVGADTAISDWLLGLPSNPDLAHRDRVLADGATYEVVGRPELQRQPGGSVHHVEARLRLIT